MYLVIFFLAVGRYVALSRKPLHCAGGFALVAFISQWVASSLLAGLVYALVVLPLAVGTYVLLDRFEDELLPWFGAAAIGAALVTFVPPLAVNTAFGTGRPGTFEAKAYAFRYPGSWKLSQEDGTVTLRASRGRATAVLAVLAKGHPVPATKLQAELQRRGRTTDGARLGGLPGVAVERTAPPDVVQHHEYVFPIPTDVLTVKAEIAGARAAPDDRRALEQELAAIEASWHWKAGAF